MVHLVMFRRLNYIITDALQIHDLQGAGHTTPFDDQTVEGIQGIVTYYIHVKWCLLLYDSNTR